MPETPLLEPVRGGRPGLFLAFEGVEGSGKTTQVRRLAELLERRGIAVIVAREPGSTPLGEKVRALVLDSTDLGVPPRSELFLMLAARAAFVEQVVRPALGARQVVVADRFELSTLAYQGAGRGLPTDEIVRANRLATGGVTPHATILLELDPHEGAERQARAAKAKDRLEREGADFHRRVADGYLGLADVVEGLIRVDASGTVEEVGTRILEALAARFPETFGESGVMTADSSGSSDGLGLQGPHAVLEGE